MYHFDATEDFFTSLFEIDTLLRLVSEDEAEEQSENRELFLKLSIVSLVTKFQVLIESILNNYIYEIRSNKYLSNNIPLYMKLNSVKLSLTEDNVFLNFTKHSNFTEDKKTNLVNYINSIDYLMKDNCVITNTFKFKTTYPLGRTGKNELIDLLAQIDGNKDLFNSAELNGEKIDISILDSLLMTRHLIIHQDRFTETKTKVKSHLEFVKTLVEFIDQYLFEKFTF